MCAGAGHAAATCVAVEQSSSSTSSGSSTLHNGVANVSPLWTAAWTKVRVACTARDEVLALSTASLSFCAQAQAAIANLTNDQKSTLGTGVYF